ncbi:S-adenosyl-L-methionine-dependent methyltransferase [Podospora conica]|nr:S-adenosyl-L-methionine-dependent methyltransferase [Schizothecium conicum]
MPSPPPPPSLSAQAAPSVNRLRDTFSSAPFSAHPKHWDLLWQDAFTPWDRGGPSPALLDLLTQHRDLFPHTSPNPTAFVPGCGRGYDVLLLSSFGYDVTGLDVSSTSLARAAETEQALASDETYAARDPGRGKGEVKWVRADFFDDGAEGVGRRFDLVFDYTFFCALPPSARPAWARRMSQLVRPSGGRLVCLEWPLTKSPEAGGPPWAVSREAYVAHLGHPGEEVAYDPETGGVASSAAEAPPSAGGLDLLFREKPARTHKAGYDDKGEVVDYISVWGPRGSQQQQQPSSYWSASEINQFPYLLRSFGTDWEAIARNMVSKTGVMVKNYYVRQKQAGKADELEAIAAEADQKRQRGEKLPAPPA